MNHETGNRRPNRCLAGPALALGLMWLAAGCTPSDAEREPSTGVLAESRSQPNILVVMTDDQGRWAAGPYGNTEIQTPHLDRLAAGGLVMDRAFSPSGVCSPARASLFTGRMPSQHGIHDFLSESIEHEVEWLGDEVLLPELLKGRGYRTGLFGKWHATPDPVPPQRGFDRWLSYDVFEFGWRNQYLHQGVVAFSDQGTTSLVDGYQAEHLTAEALDFIDGTGGQPFFAFVGYAAPHSPFEGYPERWVAAYEGAEFSSIPRGESTHLEPFGDLLPSDPRDMWTQYYAGVSFIDEQLGRLLDALDARGELENTLVVFASDHGQMMGHHGLVGKANASLPQNLYQETIQIPMVLSWPGRVPAGERSSLPFDLLDLFITLTDAGGVEFEPAAALRANRPGRSLIDKLEKPEVEWRTLQFAEHGTVRAVVGDRYKLVVRFGPLPARYGDELYDLETDPREENNLIGSPKMESVEAELRDALEAHFNRYSEPGRSGSEALSQPPSNGNEPWRRILTALEGSEV